MTGAIRIRESPPAFWCKETNRVIEERSYGGWVCNLKGNPVGVAECYSHAQYWLFGADVFPPVAGALTGLPILLKAEPKEREHAQS